MRDLIRKGKEILFQSPSVYFLPSFQFNITTVLLHCVWNFDSRFISPVTVSVYHSQIINTDVTDVLILTVKSRECQSTAMHCNEKKALKHSDIRVNINLKLYYVPPQHDFLHWSEDNSFNIGIKMYKMCSSSSRYWYFLFSILISENMTDFR